MQSSNNKSPLLNHAIRVRAKNVELRKKITQLENDIQLIEKDISTITNTYDDLVEQCQNLRDKQTDKKKDLLLEEYQTQFNNYIHDIENYLNNKQWNSPSIEKTTVLCKRINLAFQSNLRKILKNELHILNLLYKKCFSTYCRKPRACINSSLRMKD